MRVILETARAGQGFTQAVGDEIEVSDREGRAMIESGAAVAVETAMREPRAEKSVTAYGKRQGRY